MANKSTVKSNGNGSKPAHKTRNPIKRTHAIDVATLAQGLIKSADDVYAAQGVYDLTRAEYEGHVAALSIHALSEALFAGKTSEDPQRCAANDKERELAIGLTCHLDEQYIGLRTAMEEAQRDLAMCRDRQRNYRIVAELIVRS